MVGGAGGPGDTHFCLLWTADRGKRSRSVSLLCHLPMDEVKQTLFFFFLPRTLLHIQSSPTGGEEENAVFDREYFSLRVRGSVHRK